jgi:hypothetical protein
MQNPKVSNNKCRHFAALSRLLLAQHREELLSSAEGNTLLAMDEDEFFEFVRLAQSNHVIVRGLGAFSNLMLLVGDPERANWTKAPLSKESLRISRAMDNIRSICGAFQRKRLGVMVIKSLDHWPDFGSDIDLYTDASPENVCSLMKETFQAEIADRSLGDRMACKWNFNIPGIEESVEIHIRRMGQTGEQQQLASQLIGRSRQVEINNHSYRVAHIADRIMISTLQRMYRHFYFRLCDIIDSASLVSQGSIDFFQLRSFAKEAGIWEGVASYLMIVSDYVKTFSGSGLEIPDLVRADAPFGGEGVFVKGDFLRVPVMPQSVDLYREQLAGLIRRRELRSSARLGMLPWLATAAAVGYKLTGNDKGIW